MGALSNHDLRIDPRNEISGPHEISGLAALLGLVWVGEVIEVRAEATPSTSSELTSADRELLAEILATHPRYQRTLPSVHFVGTETRGTDLNGIWTQCPIPTKFEVWLDGPRKKPRYRIDYSPRVTRWSGGDSPWFVEHVTEFSDGAVSGAVDSNRDYVDSVAAVDLALTPLDNFWWRDWDDFPSRVRGASRKKNGIDFERTLLDGVPVVRIGLRQSSISEETRWFDPAKEHVMVKLERIEQRGLRPVEHLTISYREFSQLENGKWFPTEGDFLLEELRGERRFPKSKRAFNLTSVESFDSLPETFFQEKGVLAAVKQKSQREKARVPSPNPVPVGGTIVNEAGDAIIGAQIAFEGRGWKDQSTTTDIHGIFETELPNLDDVRVLISHPAFARLNYFDDFRERASQPYSALADKTARIVLERGVGITGTVSDTTGAPVAGAEIVAVRDRWGWRLPNVETDAEGHFRVPRALYHGPIYLTAQHPDFAPALQILPTAEAGDDLEATLVLPPGNTVRARVVNTTGDPVKNAVIVPDQWREHTRTIDHEMRTDEEGRFEWTTAPDDQVLYDILTDDVTLRDVPLSPSPNEQAILLVPALTVEGSVTVRGQPLESFTVTMGRKSNDADRKIHWETYNKKTFTNGIFRWECDSLRLIYHFRIEAEGVKTFESEGILPERKTIALKVKL